MPASRLTGSKTAGNVRYNLGTRIRFLWFLSVKIREKRVKTVLKVCKNAIFACFRARRRLSASPPEKRTTIYSGSLLYIPQYIAVFELLKNR